MTPTDPAVTAPKKLMTVAEFWDFVHLPQNEDRWFELRKGEVVEMPRPTRRHGAVTNNIGRILGNYTFQVGRGYIVGNDSGVILEEDPGSVVGPDVAYFMDANTFEEMHPKWGEEVPLLAVEVRSPNDKPNALIAKVRDYLTNGVKVVWLVDYEDQTVSAFRPNRTPEVFSSDQQITGGDEVPGFTCTVADFFRLPGDTPPQPSPPPVV
jgi:Uma2 family endonuclease